MKKRLLSNLKVKRISTSPYFKESFVQLEKSTIESKADAHVLPFNSPDTADILITNTHTVTSQISKNDFENCLLMIHPNSGYDNLDAEFVARAPFPIIVGNPIRAQAVSNFILSALFSHYGPLPKQKVWDDGRKWDRKLLCELSILILGHGHIGSILEAALSPLAARVQIYDPYKGATRLDLSGVDVVIPACSLNTKNIGMINHEFLMKLNEDFLLINAARGPLVKTQDLMDVLIKRPRAFAVLDVFENEPADFGVFKDVTNIQLSSHIAGVYNAIDNVTANYVAHIVADFQAMDENLFKEKYSAVLLNNRLNNDGLI